LDTFDNALTGDDNVDDDDNDDDAFPIAAVFFDLYYYYYYYITFCHNVSINGYMPHTSAHPSAQDEKELVCSIR